MFFLKFIHENHEKNDLVDEEMKDVDDLVRNNEIQKCLAFGNAIELLVEVLRKQRTISINKKAAASMYFFSYYLFSKNIF